ncbi:PilZ domain-containing protein [Colwelliaceae bacterium BS250]
MTIERRFHPRYTINLPLTISFSGVDVELLANAVNISLSGLQLEVNKSIVDEIINNTKYPAEFNISINETALTLNQIKVRLIVNRRISQQQFQLGLKFNNLHKDQQLSLENFIKQHSK